MDRLKYKDWVPITSNTGVELWDASSSNNTQESRECCIAEIASISHGPNKLLNHSKVYGKVISQGHDSMLEFIRVVDECSRNPGGITNSLRFDRSLRFNTRSDELEHRKHIALFKVKHCMPILEQILRHRAFTFCKLSRRYTKNSRVRFDFYETSSQPWWARTLTRIFNKGSVVLYSILLHVVKPEVARFVIPQSAISQMFLMVDVNGFKNFVKLRSKKNAQKEIRQITDAMLYLIKKYQPAFHQQVTED